jgi:hypothetical protein
VTLFVGNDGPMGEWGEESETHLFSYVMTGWLRVPCGVKRRRAVSVAIEVGFTGLDCHDYKDQWFHRVDLLSIRSALSGRALRALSGHCAGREY